MSTEIQHELTPTARVVLGMLALGARTGYDIKAYAERSVRFFWGASFGQIYPELRRLEAAGLVRSQPGPTGGRRRTEYDLTAAGHVALRAWLTSPEPAPVFYRDEGLLRFFFGDLVELEDALANARRMRERLEESLGLLRQIAPGVDAGEDFPLLALDFGIAFHEFAVGWWRSVEERLSRRAR